MTQGGERENALGRKSRKDWRFREAGGLKDQKPAFLYKEEAAWVGASFSEGLLKSR